jgi:hypothetical protein
VKEFGMVGLLGQGNTLGQAFEQWSPYAQWGSRLPDEQIAAASTALAAAVKAKLPELEHCLAGAGATGSIRAMFAFEPDGAAKLVRVGGLGDDPIERCLAGALRATKLPPQSAAFELACDLSRGGERPWRVTPSAGYDVITVKHDGAEHDGAGLDHAAEHPISKDHAVLIIAEPDAPAVALAAAVNAARRAPSTLVAVRADNVQVYTALVAVLEFGANRVLELAANDGTVRVVHGDAGLPAASPTDAKMLDQLLAAAKPTCPPSECTVQIDLGEHVGPNELFAIASAARRGGYDRVGVSSQASGTGDPVR